MAAHTTNPLDAHRGFLQTKRPIPNVLMDAAIGVTTAAEAFRLGDAARELAGQDERLDRRRARDT